MEVYCPCDTGLESHNQLDLHRVVGVSFTTHWLCMPLEVGVGVGQ